MLFLAFLLISYTYAYPRLERQATDDRMPRLFYPHREPERPWPVDSNAENLRSLDRTVDIDGDGHLSLEEVQYAAFVHHGLSGSVVKDMFKQVDTNHDNYLTSEEFNNIRPLVIEKAENAAQHYLQTVDLDHNQLLSLPEAQAYLLREYGIGSRDVERIWKLVNPDAKAQMDAADFAKLRRRVRGMSIRLSRQIMKYADVNADNHISLDEAQAIAFEQEGIGPGDVAEMMASVDDNQDGELNAPEFADFERIVRARAIETSKKALKVVDADGSGTLKLDEAKRIAFEHYGFDETVLAPFFDQADENEDGQLDTVEFAGFRSVIRNRAVSDAIPVLKDADLDGDGVISLDEAAEKTKREDDLEEFETKALFTLADQNKSGKLDKVELADFIRLVRLSAIKFATDHFKEFDTNGDKIVTLDELAQLIETKYGVPIEITRKFFDKVDVDHSGELIPAEIVDFRHEIRKYVASLPAVSIDDTTRDEMKTPSPVSSSSSSHTALNTVSTAHESTTTQENGKATRHISPAFKNPSRPSKAHAVTTEVHENDIHSLNQPIKTAVQLKFLTTPRSFSATHPTTITELLTDSQQNFVTPTITVTTTTTTTRRPANPWRHWRHQLTSTVGVDTNNDNQLTTDTLSQIAELTELKTTTSFTPSTSAIIEETSTVATEATTEATSKATTRRTTRARTKHTTVATTEPTTVATTELTTEAATKAATEATTEGATEATTEAATEATTEATTGAITEAITEATSQTATIAISEATAETSTVGTTAAITTTTNEATIQATSEVVTEAKTEAATVEVKSIQLATTIEGSAESPFEKDNSSEGSGEAMFESSGEIPTDTSMHLLANELLSENIIGPNSLSNTQSKELKDIEALNNSTALSVENENQKSEEIQLSLDNENKKRADVSITELEGSGTFFNEEVDRKSSSTTSPTSSTTVAEDIEYEVIAVEVDEKGNEISRRPIDDVTERRRLIEEQKRLLNIPASAEVEYLDSDDGAESGDGKSKSTRRKVSRADDAEVEIVEYIEEEDNNSTAKPSTTTAPTEA